MKYAFRWQGQRMVKSKGEKSFGPQKRSIIPQKFLSLNFFFSKKTKKNIFDQKMTF
jgi:hypothetical protein